jgi:hypothetical protein
VRIEGKNALLTRARDSLGRAQALRVVAAGATEHLADLMFGFAGGSRRAFKRHRNLQVFPIRLA